INSHAYALQIGRQFGRQSNHYQTLIWFVYHVSKIDHLIHVVTIVLDTFIWIFFITYYLSIYLQLIFIGILFSQALSTKIQFTQDNHVETSNINTDDKEMNLSKCHDCETRHEYPQTFKHYISFFRMQLTWKYDQISILSAAVWLVLFSSSHIILLLIKYALFSNSLGIMHMIIVLNPLFRAVGHLLEPIPPFIVDNERFIRPTSFKIVTILLERGERFRLIQSIIAGYLSEYQAGLPFRLPQVLVHMWTSLLIKPNIGKSLKRHYREQASRIRTKGWKAVFLMHNMFQASYDILAKDVQSKMIETDNLQLAPEGRSQNQFQHSVRA
ncbi:unnamed protein product, partial [Rotaria sordida]